MFEPLDREDDDERYSRQCRSPYAEVAKPNLGVVDDLDPKLDDDVDEDECKEDLHQPSVLHGDRV